MKKYDSLKALFERRSFIFLTSCLSLMLWFFVIVTFIITLIF